MAKFTVYYFEVFKKVLKYLKHYKVFQVLCPTLLWIRGDNKSFSCKLVP